MLISSSCCGAFFGSIPCSFNLRWIFALTACGTLFGKKGWISCHLLLYSIIFWSRSCSSSSVQCFDFVSVCEFLEMIKGMSFGLEFGMSWGLWRSWIWGPSFCLFKLHLERIDNAASKSLPVEMRAICASFCWKPWATRKSTRGVGMTGDATEHSSDESTLIASSTAIDGSRITEFCLRMSSFVA